MKIKLFAFMAVAYLVFAAFAFTSKRLYTLHYLDESQVATTVIGNLQYDVDDPENWATGLSAYFANGTKLAAIGFDQEMASDGSGDGQLSKTEAVHAVYSYYVLNGHTLPPDGYPINVQIWGPAGNDATYIIIRRKN